MLVIRGTSIRGSSYSRGVIFGILQYCRLKRPMRPFKKFVTHLSGKEVGKTVTNVTCEGDDKM